MRRRHSVIGPMVLILIGGIFLLQNVMPGADLFELLARNWPYLLIVWGGIRLLEVIVWQVAGKPVPANGVSGGEWTLIVLLCVFGSMLFWGMNYASHWPAGRVTLKGLEIFGDTYEFPVAAEKEVGKNPRIVLELGRGNARIVGTDESILKITGHKTIRAYQQGDANQGDRETPLEIVQLGDQTVIRTNQEKLDGSRQANAELEIRLPKGTNFEGRGRYGDFDISDVAGRVDIQSDNAGVRISNAGSDVRVELRRSDIVRVVNAAGGVDIKSRSGQDVEVESVAGLVSVNGSFSGELGFRNLSKPLRFESQNTELRVERIPGFVRFALGNLTAENVQGPFVLRTRTRDVQIRDFTESVMIALDRGDVELRPSKQMGKIDVRTKNGDVDLILPIGSHFDLNAHTDRGEITNDFGESLKATEESDRGASLRGSTGQGPSITIDTQRGGITVSRTDNTSSGNILPKKLPAEAPEPPKPPKVPSTVEQ